MSIAVTARASALGTQTKSASFGAQTQNLPSKVALMLQYTAALGVVENKLSRITNPEDAGTRFGYGSPIHRASIRQWAVHEGAIPVYALPIADPAGAVASGGVIDFTGSLATASGAVVAYIGGDRYSLPVSVDDTPTILGDALVAALAADANGLVTGVNTTGSVALTSKWLGEGANAIDVSLSLGATEVLPAGVSVAVSDMANGVGDESTVMQDAFDEIGNVVDWFTDIVIPVDTTLAQDVAKLNIGTPDDNPTGLYEVLDYRPATAWSCSTASGSTGLNAALARGAARTTDAANDWVQAPDYPELGFEIASSVCATVAIQANNNPASHYEKTTIIGLFGPKDNAEDWASGKGSYPNRDAAVKAGITVLTVTAEGVTLGDVTSFYHPASLINAAMQLEVNKRKVWNMAFDLKNDKADPARQGQVIVARAEAATNQSKATDTDIEGSRVVALADLWEERGLIYESLFTKKNLVVEINSQNPDRIDRAVPVILSGNARIRDDQLLADRNINLSGTLVTITIGG